MNEAVYEQFEFKLKKYIYIYIFVCLVNKSNLSPNLGAIIKQVKLKHNNVFINKLMNLRLFFFFFLKNINLRLDLTIYNIIFLYVYLSKNILI